MMMSGMKSKGKTPTNDGKHFSLLLISDVVRGFMASLREVYSEAITSLKPLVEEFSEAAKNNEFGDVGRDVGYKIQIQFNLLNLKLAVDEINEESFDRLLNLTRTVGFWSRALTSNTRTRIDYKDIHLPIFKINQFIIWTLLASPFKTGEYFQIQREFVQEIASCYYWIFNRIFTGIDLNIEKYQTDRALKLNQLIERFIEHESRCAAENALPPVPSGSRPNEFSGEK